MRIRSLSIKNFRSIQTAQVLFKDHVVLVGGNSVGKSTLCEAMDLLLGPDRLSRASPVDEHDFPGRRYLDSEGNPIAIEIEGVLTDFSSDLATRYRAHLESWDTEARRLLDQTDGPEDVESSRVIPALRIYFYGAYNKDEDEFAAETRFASPPSESDRNRVSRADKRRFGFLYLRALRTGSRALTLERGSLLDIILKLKDDDRSQMWEQTLQALENLSPAIHDIPQLRDVLCEVEARVRKFVTLSPQEPSFGLFASALTRDSLRQSVTLYGRSERPQSVIPYWRLGSGVISAMVFSLLTFVAELKQNVIFAMEEPELAIPPHTQRRLVQFLKQSVDQVILTTHSPFVLEQFAPEHVVLLDRDDRGMLAMKPLALGDLKAKTYRGGLRKHFAEAMLGRGVICVEGLSDCEVLQIASAILEAESTPTHPYTHLDVSGVTVIACDGEGAILPYGNFFSELGLKTYAFCDRQKHLARLDEIRDCFDRLWELEHSGMEKLLATEIPLGIIQRFLATAQDWNDYPVGDQYAYDAAADGASLRETCFDVLRQRKGAGYAGRLIELCSAQELPSIVVDALREVSQDLPNELVPAAAGTADESHDVGAK